MIPAGLETNLQSLYKTIIKIVFLQVVLLCKQLEKNNLYASSKIPLCLKNVLLFPEKNYENILKIYSSKILFQKNWGEILKRV